MSRRGLSLVECLVGVTVSSVLLGATCAVLVAAQRSAVALAAALEARHNAEAVGAVLRAELARAARGELIRLTDSAVSLRALRGTGAACVVDPARSLVVLDTVLFTSLRAIDPSRDSVRLLAEGDPQRTDDDAWLQAGIAGVLGGACPGAGAGIALRLSGLLPAEWNALAAGAPARIVEIVEYRRYPDAAGERWFGVRSPSGLSWSASSPVAGPLDPAGGLVVTYANELGAATTTPDSVRLIEVQVRVRGRLVHGSAGIRPARDSSFIAAATGGP